MCITGNVHDLKTLSQVKSLKYRVTETSIGDIWLGCVVTYIFYCSITVPVVMDGRHKIPQYSSYEKESFIDKDVRSRDFTSYTVTKVQSLRS